LGNGLLYFYVSHLQQTTLIEKMGTLRKPHKRVCSLIELGCTITALRRSWTCRWRRRTDFLLNLNLNSLNFDVGLDDYNYVTCSIYTTKRCFSGAEAARFAHVHTARLIVTSLGRDDGGLYTCTARNVVGEDYRVFTLVVEGEWLMCLYQKLTLYSVHSLLWQPAELTLNPRNDVNFTEGSRILGRSGVPVCVSVCTRPRFTKLLCMLPVAVARSSSGGVGICNVLPVLWMTSRFVQ